MTRHRSTGFCAILAVVAALGGCQSEPRSVDFFEAHEAEAKKVQESCSSGSTRGPECENASIGLARIQANRMLEFKPTRAPEKP